MDILEHPLDDRINNQYIKLSDHDNMVNLYLSKERNYVP